MNKPFKQIIRNVQGSSALVESRKGNIYPVVVSDYVRIHKSKYLKVGVTGLVKRINGRYYLIDVETPIDEDYNEIPPEDMGYKGW